MRFHGQVIRGHITFRELEQTVGKDAVENKFKFSFTRNTWDRVLSLYSHFGQRSKQDPRYIHWEKIGFDEWVKTELEGLKNHKRWGNDMFTQQQKEWVSGVDFVGRFEHLEEDWKHVCDIIGTEVELLYTPRNKTKHKSYRNEYTQQSIEVVAKVFAEDIEYFGHKFG